MFERVWTDDLIIKNILDWKASGKPLYSSYVYREFPTLHRAAFSLFGNWENAITAAGLDYDKIRRNKRWTKDRIVNEIKNLYEAGEDLSWYVFSQGDHAALAAAAITRKHFGSWKKALAAAGLNEEEISRYRHWSRDDIIKRIKEMKRSGQSLSAQSVQKRDSKFYFAAIRQFQNWRTAAEKAGYKYRKVAIRARWGKDEVLKQLKKLHKKNIHLSGTNVKEKYPALYAGAIRAFGSFRKARAALLGEEFDLRFKASRSFLERKI